MPWRAKTIMDERIRFLVEAQNSHFAFAELCRRYGISRPTGYKWLDRGRDGYADLADRSHRPHSCPHSTPPAVVARILELRARRGWGARKIGTVLKREMVTAPCTDTVHRVLQSHGLIDPSRKPRRQRSSATAPSAPADCPNALWTADFKGQFKTLDGLYCYPLTVQDHASRFILECRGLLTLDMAAVIRRFDSIFERFGVPDSIRTDNGHPFASGVALGRLSRLSVHWIKLGIRPQQIEPGKPQQNGRHERMHRTLKAETTRPSARNLRSQQRRFDEFVRIFNEERPHQALEQRTPASVYVSSVRAPTESPFEYPRHFEIRQVSQDATLRWRCSKVAVSHLLKREIVGLEEIDDGVWAVYFGPVLLGWLDEADNRIMDRLGTDRTR